MHRRIRLLLVTATGVAALLPITQDRAAHAADATVTLSATKQLIRGFGASSAWCGTVSTSIMDSLFKDLGYSILRVRIEEAIGDGWSSGSYSAWAPELANAKNAIARGAIVFASPWNPPASMKSGGKLITSKYSDYASYLKAYAKYFADNNAPLYAISVQNEPDYASSWTAWTATDLLNFLKQEGAGLSSAIKVMMPESFQFRHPMSDPSLNDATVASYISIIGGHLYGSGIAPYPLATDQGKELWETEHYFDDDTIGNITKMGKEIHDCMVTASMNAYVYWWITYGNGLATSSGSIYKRAYVLGQFAKYIRPGYHRVDATASPTTNVSVSAYTGEGKVVIVAVNTGTGSVNQSFAITGGTVSQVSSSQTDPNNNMAAGQTYPVSGGTFTAPLAGQSITTFVGSLSGYVSPLDSGVSDVGGNIGGKDSAGNPTDGNTGSGGRGDTGGTSGVGGSTVHATGGGPGSGGSSATGSGGSPVGTTAASSGGTTADSSKANGQGGSAGGATTTTGNQSSGCGCVVGGRPAPSRGLGLAFVGTILALWLGVPVRIRRRR
jgi:glucuronoarabinoxylan endo-1,4-beta-xylanase